MDADEVRKKLSAHEIGMPLDAMSAGELRERIELLEGEITRLRAAIAMREQTKAAAESIFKF